MEFVPITFLPIALVLPTIFDDIFAMNVCPNRFNRENNIFSFARGDGTVWC